MFTDKQLYILLALGAVGILIASNAAADAARAVDPLNNDNVFNNYFDRAARVLSGREVNGISGAELTFGGWLAGG